MFEDRNKGYDFSKYDKHARTQMLVEEKKSSNNDSQAYKTLFTNEKPKEKENVSTDILGRPRQSEINETQEEVKHDRLSNLPSSAYLRQFENQIVTEVEQEETESQVVDTDTKQETNIDFSNLMDLSESSKKSALKIYKELKKISAEPKKNYSFRIKLIAGVYCILVALFGGWVIGNAIDIIQTNNNIHNIVSKTEDINADIADVILKMKQLDSVSPDDRKEDSLLVQITTETIEITPETIEEPTEYAEKSNWFDIICDGLSGIFGG